MPTSETKVPDRLIINDAEKPSEGYSSAALGHTSLMLVYFTPNEISGLRPSALNTGTKALKGTVTEMLYDSESGFYKATAALGNVTSHDHLRELSGSKRNFGFSPPDNFAHDFAGIYANWYPLIDRTQLTMTADNLRPGATIEDFEKEQAILWAVGARLEYATGALGKAIKVGLLPDDKQLKDTVFSEPFNPKLPQSSVTVATFMGDGK